MLSRATDPPTRIPMARRFVQELQRRRVLKVGVVYAVVGYAVIEVADLLLPNLGLPPSAVTLVIALVLLGFPLAVVLSWMFDVTPAGIERTPDSAGPSEPAGAKTSASSHAAAAPAAPVPADSRRAAAPTTRSRSSIAVLSFADMSPDGDHEYFCDGIAEEIIDSLTHVEGLRVAARTSAFAYKASDTDVRAIGRELGVDVVLEGSVRKSGSRLRITAQLIDVDDGYHLWSERYDREMADIFDIQDDIACTVADRLGEALGIAAARPDRRRGTENAEAYEQYLKGSYYWTRRHRVGIERSIECFRAALDLDPGYARAHAGASVAHVIGGFYRLTTPREAWRLADEAADRALALDPELSEALTAKGLTLTWYGWEFARGVELLDRAVRLDPENGQAHLFHAYALITRGRVVEAREALHTGLRVDPESPSTRMLAGAVAYILRDVDHAIRICSEALSDDPTQILPRYVRGMARHTSGDLDAALEDHEAALELSGRNPTILAIHGVTLAEKGDLAAARAVLDELRSLRERVFLSSTEGVIAWILGDEEYAGAAIGHAIESREPNCFMIGSVPLLDPLRTHPAWPEWIRRVGVVDVLA